MYMKFTWGAGGTDDDFYLVLGYNVSVNTLVGDAELRNCSPSELSLTLDIPTDVNPAAEFFKFAGDQHSIAKEKGQGTLSVFKGKDVDETIQEITFMDGWITSLEMGVSTSDKTFLVHVRFAAAIITISGETFVHGSRSSNFTKK
jgi:hypothetical protein